MRAAAYARVNHPNQLTADARIRWQLEQLAQWARGHGHELRPEHVFLDRGQPEPIAGRPGLRALLEAVHQGDVDLLIAFSPDRLAREEIDLDELLATIRGRGCTVVFFCFTHLGAPT